MTTHAVLVAAKEHLLLYGHQKGALGERGGPCCVGGAVLAVAGYGNPISAHVFRELRGALGEEWQQDFIDFNNAPETTIGDVVDLLDRAILATAPKDTVSLDAELAGAAA